MHFDPNNSIVQLCSRGMEMEGEGNKQAAGEIFQRAWEESTTDMEKFTAAHYVARHQDDVAGKLAWDTVALTQALAIRDAEVLSVLPSLYLNTAKGYEDLGDFDQAMQHYRLADSFTAHLPDDGYGQLIRIGIQGGMERVRQQVT